MNILVTGIGGFIAQNVVRNLNLLNYNITGIYRKKKPSNLNCELRQCDLSDDEEVKQILNRNFDTIIHFAAQTEGKCIGAYIKNTIETTENLIYYSQKYGIKNFIYISSVSVNGEVLGTIDEMSDKINLNDYGVTKYIGERIVEDSNIEHKVILRLPRVLGRGINLNSPWLPRVSKELLNNQNIYYSNPNLNYNSVIHINDLSNFIITILKQNIEFEIFTLGAKEGLTIIEILRLLKKELNSNSELIEKKSIARTKCYSINIEKSLLFGYNPMTTEQVLKLFIKDISEIF